MVVYHFKEIVQTFTVTKNDDLLCLCNKGFYKILNIDISKALLDSENRLINVEKLTAGFSISTCSPSTSYLQQDITNASSAATCSPRTNIADARPTDYAVVVDSRGIVYSAGSTLHVYNSNAFPREMVSRRLSLHKLYYCSRSNHLNLNNHLNLQHSLFNSFTAYMNNGNKINEFLLSTTNQGALLLIEISSAFNNYLICSLNQPILGVFTIGSNLLIVGQNKTLLYKSNSKCIILKEFPHNITCIQKITHNQVENQAGTETKHCEATLLYSDAQRLYKISVKLQPDADEIEIKVLRQIKVNNIACLPNLLDQDSTSVLVSSKLGSLCNISIVEDESSFMNFDPGQSLAHCLRRLNALSTTKQNLKVAAGHLSQTVQELALISFMNRKGSKMSNIFKLTSQLKCDISGISSSMYHLETHFMALISPSVFTSGNFFISFTMVYKDFKSSKLFALNSCDATFKFLLDDISSNECIRYFSTCDISLVFIQKNYPENSLCFELDKVYLTPLDYLVCEAEIKTGEKIINNNTCEIESIYKRLLGQSTTSPRNTFTFDIASISLEELLKSNFGYSSFSFPYEREFHDVSIVVKDSEGRLSVQCRNPAVLLLLIEGINQRIRYLRGKSEQEKEEEEDVMMNSLDYNSLLEEYQSMLLK